MTDPTRAAEDAARASYGKLVAILAAQSGDIAAAEDALTEAFIQALRLWPERGIPDRPEAWLLTTARNRRIDAARRDKRVTFTDEMPEIAMPDPHTFPDDRLKLMFVCAHPAIDEAIRTPLMLQTVLGVQAADIARIFHLPPATMAQRLVRVKRKIKDTRIPFTLPDDVDLPDRIGALLDAVYAAFAVDWQEGAGDLSHEAHFLATTLADLLPDNAEALGLAALITFVEARRDASPVDGVYVPLPDQDIGLWNTDLIDHAALLLTRASALQAPGRLQLEAAIQAVHAERHVTGVTNWRALSQLYAGLMQITPSLGAAVGRAVAVGEDAGALEGLRLLDLIDADAAEAFQPYWATRAHLLAASAPQEAAEAYSRAIELSTYAPATAWLEARRTALRSRLL
ncbi:RNA polymerase sigma factor [Gymnodinialimonas hymeniacidonis]|uniref:RNA polymerase sigma factor n=1 Tax=Gymnodinialimonas hymeniacidonis TaxID=3126508 RepID=UPI0034C6B498